MLSFRALPSLLSRPLSSSSLRYASTSSTLGVIGLGHMGSNMVRNWSKDGKTLTIYDKNLEAAKKLEGLPGVTVVNTISDLVKVTNTIVSILPNDKIVKEVCDDINKVNKGGIYHISCSTISPTTSRQLAKDFSKLNSTFIASPVFARPDGLAKRQATWVIAGSKEGKDLATNLLSSMGKCIDFGDDVGASNIVKLCGNFLIATSIESIAESMALAEKHGVDRTKVMDLLSSTIFDCLIFKGYGKRVSERDHRPGGFSLTLGHKDVMLVSEAAREGEVPMPFLSTLVDRFTSAKAKGRADFDWSAIGLNVSEDSGIDISKDIATNIKNIKEGNTY